MSMIDALRAVVSQRLRPNGAASPLTRAAAAFLAELGHTAASARGRVQLNRIGRASAGVLRVHLGCGHDVRAGWLNIDLGPGRASRQVAREAGTGTWLIRYDLRRGLPLPPRSCRLIYSSHFLEHLEFVQGLRIVKDSYDALVPGGVFRAALPDFAALFAAYLREDREFAALLNIADAFPYNEPGTEGWVDVINYGVYQDGEHRCIYDADKIMRVLRAAGFAEPRIVDYDSVLDPGSEQRRRYSFYVEAVR